MCGEFVEVTAIISLVFNFLALRIPLLSFRDTSSYVLCLLCFCAFKGIARFV